MDVDLKSLPSVGIVMVEVASVERGQPVRRLGWKAVCDGEGWEGRETLSGRAAQAEAMAHHAEHVRDARAKA